MDKSKPRLYRTRLWIAKRRRHLNQWILRRLFSTLESLTKKQLSLLNRKEKCQLLLSLPETMEVSEEEKDRARSTLLQLNLLFPIALESSLMLEDLQLISRAMITSLRVKR